jgi:hypothetical protein
MAPSAPHEDLEVGARSGPSIPTSASAGPAMDEAAKGEFLWHAHQYINEYVRFADTKAAFAGAVASALLGTLYTAKAYVPLLSRPWSQWSAGAWLTFAASFFLAGSVALALLTVRPRLRSTQSKGHIFWGSIGAHGSVELFQTCFHSQSPWTLNDHLLHHLYEVASKVSIPKYRLVSLSITTLGIGGLLASAALLLNDMPKPPNTSQPTSAGAPARPVPSPKK